MCVKITEPEAQQSMKTISLSQLQKELATLEKKQVLEICMKLAKHKKENKELLSYLLFGSADEKQYLEESKEKLDDLFLTVSRKTTYTTKKGLQKVVRHLNKFIKTSKNKQTEVELRIYFCSKIRAARINLDSSGIISNLYYREKDKINLALSKLHEDVQFDYRGEVEKI